MRAMDETLRTPEEWSRLDGLTVRDPDGWRLDGKSWDAPITLKEWRWRSAISTVDSSGYRSRPRER